MVLNAKLYCYDETSPDYHEAEKVINSKQIDLKFNIVFESLGYHEADKVTNSKQIDLKFNIVFEIMNK